MGLPVVSDTLQGYLTEVNRHPLLTPEEELTIAERYYKSRNIEDAHGLVVSNLRYVVKIALEYRNYGCRMADLIQEGNIGLMTAVKKFNPCKGFRLITYAAWWIRASIQDFILKSRGLVRRGTRALKRQLFYKKDLSPSSEGSFKTGFDGKSPCIDIEASRVSRNVSNVASADLSLNTAVSDEKTTHLDLLRDIRPNQEELYAAKEEQAVVKREVKNALALLNDKERFIIERRIMSDEPESLQGIGDTLGLTRERVRQIESAALKKLKNSLA